MITQIIEKLTKIDLQPPSQNIQEFKIQFAERLPGDYMNFIESYNGGYGFIGKAENYIDLWPIETITQNYPLLSGQDDLKDILIIGTNGSGTLYGFNLPDRFCFEADQFNLMDKISTTCGHSFLDLLHYLSSKTDD